MRLKKEKSFNSFRKLVKSDAFNTSKSKTSCNKYKKNKPHSVLWLVTSGLDGLRETVWPGG